MIAGFALLAWPAKYGETGVTTFAVNQQGVVYQIDLGQSTESIANPSSASTRAMTGASRTTEAKTT